MIEIPSKTRHLTYISTCSITNYLLGILLLMYCAPLAAQDSHYWNLSYGTRSTLLNGVVIGSHLDISSTYYNPGALGLIDNPALLLSGQIYTMTSYLFQDGAGDDIDLSSLKFRKEPDIIAGLTTLDKLAETRLAISYLSRQRVKFRLKTRQGELRDVIARSPGEEPFGSEVILDQDMNEDWAGLTVSKKINDNVGFGVTNYVAVRNQRLRSQVVSEAVTDRDVAVTLDFSEVDYSHWRLLWKLGLAIERDRLNLGFSMTTPSVSLGFIGFLAKGTAIVNETVTGQDVNGDGLDNVFAAGTAQEGVDAHYKSSWALGMGGSYRFTNATIHFSVEWFNAVKEFDVLQVEDIAVANSDRTIPLRVTHKQNSVINFGFGYEYQFNPKFSGYGSFSTDFSALEKGKITDIAITNWDIFHLTVGGRIKIPTFELTLGLGYSFGSGINQQPLNFTDAHESNFLLGTRGDIESKYQRLTAILGFSFNLGG